MLDTFVKTFGKRNMLLSLGRGEIPFDRVKELENSLFFEGETIFNMPLIKHKYHTDADNRLLDICIRYDNYQLFEYLMDNYKMNIEYVVMIGDKPYDLFEYAMFWYGHENMEKFLSKLISLGFDPFLAHERFAVGKHKRSSFYHCLAVKGGNHLFYKKMVRFMKKYFPQDVEKILTTSEYGQKNETVMAQHTSTGNFDPFFFDFCLKELGLSADEFLENCRRNLRNSDFETIARNMIKYRKYVGEKFLDACKENKVC